jgi:hypothetical protein
MREKKRVHLRPDKTTGMKMTTDETAGATSHPQIVVKTSKMLGTLAMSMSEADTLQGNSETPALEVHDSRNIDMIQMTLAVTIKVPAALGPIREFPTTGMRTSVTTTRATSIKSLQGVKARPTAITDLLPPTIVITMTATIVTSGLLKITSMIAREEGLTTTMNAVATTLLDSTKIPTTADSHPSGKGQHTNSKGVPAVASEARQTLAATKSSAATVMTTKVATIEEKSVFQCPRPFG